MDHLFSGAVEAVREQGLSAGRDSMLREELAHVRHYARLADQDKERLLVLLTHCLRHIDKDWDNPVGRGKFVAHIKERLLDV